MLTCFHTTLNMYKPCSELEALIVTEYAIYVLTVIIFIS